MLQTILDAVPALLVAAVIVLIGYVVAKAVRSLVESFLSGIGADELPGRLGLTFLEARAGQTPPSKLIGAVTAVVILLITAQQACAKLRFDQLADLLQRIVAYLPNLAVGLIILLAAMSLGRSVPVEFAVALASRKKQPSPSPAGASNPPVIVSRPHATKHKPKHKSIQQETDSLRV